MSINHLLDSSATPKYDIFVKNIDTTELNTSRLNVYQDLEVKGDTDLTDTSINGSLNVTNQTSCLILKTPTIRNSSSKVYVNSAPTFVSLATNKSATIQSISQIKYLRDEYDRYNVDLSIETQVYTKVLKVRLYFNVSYGDTSNQFMYFSAVITDIPSYYQNGVILYSQGLVNIALSTNGGKFVLLNVDNTEANNLKLLFGTSNPQLVSTFADDTPCQCDVEILST